MLALDLDVGVAILIAETLVSPGRRDWCHSARAGFVARKPTARRIAGAVPCSAAASPACTTWGMFGMRFGATSSGLYDVVSVSIIIAIVAATAALWLAFNTRTMVLRTRRRW